MADKLMFASLILLIIALPAMADPFELRPYKAEYSGKYEGLPVRAKGVRELVVLEDGSYKLTSSAKAMMMNVSEVSHFRLTDEGILPESYLYQRSTFGRKKQESVQFNWQTMTASHEDTTSELEPGTLDKLSYQTQLRLDVAKGIGSSENTLTYLIADEEKRKTYEFRFLREETLETPLGDIRTVVVERYREDKDRRTTVWLALDHQYLMARLRQTEPDSGFELNLEQFEFTHSVEVTDN